MWRLQTNGHLISVLRQVHTLTQPPIVFKNNEFAFNNVYTFKMCIPAIVSSANLKLYLNEIYIKIVLLRLITIASIIIFN